MDHLIEAHEMSVGGTHCGCSHEFSPGKPPRGVPAEELHALVGSLLGDAVGVDTIGCD